MQKRIRWTMQEDHPTIAGVSPGET